MDPLPLHPEISIAQQHEIANEDYLTGVNGFALPPSQFLPKEKALQIPINPDMTFRRIYFYGESDLTVPGSDYFVESELVFYKGGSQVSRALPVCIGSDANGNTVKRTLVNVCTGTNAPGSNAILAVLSKKFAVNSVYLNPAFFRVDANLLVLRVVGGAVSAGLINQYRAMVACISSFDGWSG